MKWKRDKKLNLSTERETVKDPMKKGSFVQCTRELGGVGYVGVMWVM